MEYRDCSLQRVAIGAAGAQHVIDQRQALADLVAIPAAAVLLREQRWLPIVLARIAPRMLKQHQRQQRARTRLHEHFVADRPSRARPALPVRGAYKVFAFDEVAAQLDTLPRGAWTALGVVELAGGLLLVVPWALGRMPSLTPVAAAMLALETFALAAVYASHSLAISATNPLLWALTMGVLVTFVAYGRSQRA